MVLPAPTPHSKRAPVGVITGGVVGGISIIFLVALSIFLLRAQRRRRSRRDPYLLERMLVDRYLEPAPSSAPLMSSTLPALTVPSQVAALESKVKALQGAAGSRDGFLRREVAAGQSDTPSSVGDRGQGITATLGVSAARGSRTDDDIREQVAGMQIEIARLRSMQRHQEARLDGEIEMPPEYSDSGR